MNENKFETLNKVMEEKIERSCEVTKHIFASIWYEHANEAFVCVLGFAPSDGVHLRKAKPEQLEEESMSHCERPVSMKKGENSLEIDE